MTRNAAINIAIEAIRLQMKEKDDERCKRSMEKWSEAILVLLKMREGLDDIKSSQREAD